MKTALKNISWPAALAQSGNLLLVVGLFIAEITPLPLSLSVFFIFIAACITRGSFLQTLRVPLLVSCMLVWVFVLMSGLYSENVQRWSDLLVRKLPILLLPFALLSFQQQRLRTRWYLRLFVYLTSALAVMSLLQLIMNYDRYAEGIIHSKQIPVWPEGNGISHIYFSVFQSFSVLACIYFFIPQPEFPIRKRSRHLFLALGIFNFIGLHILSSRTGLVALYASLGIAGTYFMLQKGKIKWLLSGILLLILLPVIAYFSLGTFRDRVQNTVTDLRILQAGEDINHRSFAMRMEASKNGLAIIADHWLLGVGAGDLDSAMKEKYVERNTVLMPGNRIMPHNEFIETWVGSGLLGFLSLLGVFVFTWIRKKYVQHFLMLSFSVLLFFSFLAESMLERQIGITFFVWGYTLLVSLTPLRD